jgi:GNAT superfamily N-acetyltransferase
VTDQLSSRPRSNLDLVGDPTRAADRVALEHESWIAYLTGAVSYASGAKVTREDGVTTILSGLPMDWFDQILIEREEADPAALLAAVVTARQSRGRFVVRLRDGLDDRFIPTIMRAGLVRAGDASSVTGMVAFPIDPDVIRSHGASGLAIRRVTDDAGIDEHRQVSTAGFGSGPAVARGTACSALLDRPGCVLHLGYQGDAPVVSGLGWRTGRTIGVFSIATIESARRRGYGAAMTARVMADGVAAGCDVAALQASEMGRPIYERLGFRTVVWYIAYTDPASSA